MQCNMAKFCAREMPDRIVSVKTKVFTPLKHQGEVFNVMLHSQFVQPSQSGKQAGW